MTRLSNKNQYGSETGSSYNPISEEGNGNIAENNPSKLPRIIPNLDAAVAKYLMHEA